jgi:hypothetical protein
MSDDDRAELRLPVCPVLGTVVVVCPKCGACPCGEVGGCDECDPEDAAP